jgi:predicted MPP superfamily phosphohydrolase
MFEMDWGYLKKDNYQVIVSCGFGTWGPPIRIGNCPEIIDLMIHFEKKNDNQQNSQDKIR